jgi:hypothetical protein
MMALAWRRGAGVTGMVVLCLVTLWWCIAWHYNRDVESCTRLAIKRAGKWVEGGRGVVEFAWSDLHKLKKGGRRYVYKL